MPRREIEVVHVGSATRDIADDDPRGWRLGGGVTYAALTTARLGIRTAAIVGVDAEARTAAELDTLRDAGVDLLLLPVADGPVFHNLETPRGRVQTAIQAASALTPQPLPDSWAAARGWSLVPVAGEVGDDWVDLVPDDAIVAVGWQGLLRRVMAGERVVKSPPRRRAILERADLVGVSRDDVEPSTSLVQLVGYLRPGARLLVTQGSRGGLLLTAGRDGPVEALRYLPTRTDREVDPTGAGDTFLAALLAATIRPALGRGGRTRLESSLRFAAAAGSLAVEDVGLAGVPDQAAVLVRSARERVRRAVLPSVDAQVGEADADAFD